MPLTPEQRVLRARVAAHVRWSKAADRAAATAPARKALLDRFEKEVDPDGVMDPAARAKCADSARKAFYGRLALKSATARAARRETSDGGEADAAA